jgi:hypothetical protein
LCRNSGIMGFVLFLVALLIVFTLSDALRVFLLESSGAHWLGALIGWIDGLPRWQRPIFNGALLVLAWFTAKGGFFLFPLVLLVGGYRHGWEFVRPALLLPFVAVLAGALGGAAYSILLPVRRLGGLGRWLSWILAVMAYSVPVMLLWAPVMHPQMQWDAPSTRFAWVLAGLWFGSLGYWCFGRDEDPWSRKPREPSAEEILAGAVTADLQELGAAGSEDPSKLEEVAQIQGNAASRALVMHWWRVAGRLGRKPGTTWDLAHRWALNRAEAKLRRAQLDWNRVSGLDA